MEFIDRVFLSFLVILYLTFSSIMYVDTRHRSTSFSKIATRIDQIERLLDSLDLTISDTKKDSILSDIDINNDTFIDCECCSREDISGMIQQQKIIIHELKNIASGIRKDLKYW